jgi:hypothetical protein
MGKPLGLRPPPSLPVSASAPEAASALRRPLNHTILTSSVETTACFSAPVPASALGRLQIIQFLPPQCPCTLFSTPVPASALRGFKSYDFNLLSRDYSTFLNTCTSLCSRESSKSYNFNLLSRDYSQFFNTFQASARGRPLNHTILTSSLETTASFLTPFKPLL